MWSQEEEQAIVNEYIVEVDLPYIGRKKVVGNVIGLSGTPGTLIRYRIDIRPLYM